MGNKLPKVLSFTLVNAANITYMGNQVLRVLLTF
jgi:hypothetical protein